MNGTSGEILVVACGERGSPALMLLHGALADCAMGMFDVVQRPCTGAEAGP